MEHVNAFIKHNYAKLRDLYLSMTLGNRIVSALLFATLLISLGYLIVGGIKPPDPRTKTVMMYDGYMFSTSEKGAAEYAFSRARLTDHNWIGNQLQVPTHQRPDYARILAEADVPESSGKARQTAAQNLSAWQSARMMNTQMIAAKERDTVDAIKKIPGIFNVTILTHQRPEWERNVWARRQVMSVSVIVEAVETKPLRLETISTIGNLVANAFGITNRKEISITDSKNSRSYDGLGVEVNSAQGEYLQNQLRHQEEWDNRIHLHMGNIPGLKVATSVTLSQYRTRNSFEIEHGRPTPLVTHELDYHFKKEGWDRFFRPGQTAQWSRPLIDPTGNVSPKDLIDEKKRETETSHALQGTETKNDLLPYIPLRVSTSIRVPREHILKIWRERNRQLGGDPETQPTPEELLAEEERFTINTKQSIGALLVEYRASNREDPMNLVIVTFEDIIREIQPELTAWQEFLLFMQHHWQSIGLMSLVFCGLVVLWIISKQPKPEPIVIYEGLETPLEAIDARIAERRRLEAEAAAAITAAAEETGPEFENTLGELGSLRSLKDEIAELIAKNPEAAAAVIRQWVGNAVLVEAKT